jgi:hypothetical protein
MPPMPGPYTRDRNRQSCEGDRREPLRSPKPVAPHGALEPKPSLEVVDE